LHLEEAIAASTGEPYAIGLGHQHLPSCASQTLVDGPLFLLDQV